MKIGKMQYYGKVLKKQLIIRKRGRGGGGEARVDCF